MIVGCGMQQLVMQMQYEIFVTALRQLIDIARTVLENDAVVVLFAQVFVSLFEEVLNEVIVVFIRI